MDLNLYDIWLSDIDDLNFLVKDLNLDGEDVEKRIIISEYYGMSGGLSEDENNIVKSEYFREVMEDNGTTYAEIMYKLDKLRIMTLHWTRKVTKISGISFFVYFDDIYSDRILFLGEEHTNEYSCDGVSVSEWLYELVRNTNKCIDLFLEIPNHKIEHNLNEDSQLAFIANKFNKNGFENLRYHKIDNRLLIVNGNNDPFALFLSKFQEGLNVEEKNRLNDAEDYSDLYSSEIFTYRIGANTSEKYRKIFQTYQYKLTGNQDINHQLKYLEIMTKQLSKLEDFDTDYFFNCIIKTQEILKNYFFLFITNLPMDIYFLLRYLQNYKENTLNRGPKKCQHSEHQYSIVYTGNSHINFYKHFFQLYWNIKPKININSTQCITLKIPFDFLE